MKFSSSRSIISVILTLLLFNIYACNKNKIEQQLTLTVPNGWDPPLYNFSDNELSNAKFELGRRLFYETKLSSTNSISCGSCHQSFAAFAQIDHNLSHGVNDSLGNRNSPPLFNLIWHPSFMWDGGVNHIETQPASPITNPVEMHETLDNVVNKLKADPNYIALFKKAYGDETINTQRMFKSLAQFMGLMISSNSKYDKYYRGENGGEFNTQELAGLQIFNDKCASCHKAPLFSDFSFRSNGLPPIVGPNGRIDSGKAHIPPFDVNNMFKFKVPSLRNLKYTKPYMHDGRFNTLDQVLNHYATIDPTALNLDPLLSNGIPLSQTEKANLLAFLNTLNDEEFVKDKRFVEP